MNVNPKKIALIGLGLRTTQKIIPSLMPLVSEGKVNVIAVCDCDETKLDSFRAFPSATPFASVQALLAWHASGHPIDVAYISLPHKAQASVTSVVLMKGIHCLKEKPSAISVDELYHLVQVSRNAGARLGIASQRRFSEKVRKLKEWIQLVGAVSSCEIVSKIPVEDLTAGWRAQRALCGGGVVLDLGWHSFVSRPSLLASRRSAVVANLRVAFGRETS